MGGESQGVAPSLLADLATVAGQGETPDHALVARLQAAFPGLEERAGDPPGSDPYSRLLLHADDDVEVMVARWRPGARCAPHDHGGSGGFVSPSAGPSTSTASPGRAPRWRARSHLARHAGDAFGFGPDVVHAMAAGPAG